MPLFGSVLLSGYRTIRIRISDERGIMISVGTKDPTEGTNDRLGGCGEPGEERWKA
jgi:hypothetical protein